MLKVVLDTNVLISAILFGGKPRMIFELILEGELKLGMSQSIMNELYSVLARPKFDFPASWLDLTMSEMKAIADVISEDPDDNRIIECAISSGADFLISSEKHLLNLEMYRGIPICDPATFLNIIAK